MEEAIMKLFQMTNSCDGAYDSLDVRFTKDCDNRCSFCIEREGLADLGMAPLEDLVKSTRDSGIKNVLVLGGEPALHIEKLVDYVVAIRSFVDTVYVTTSLPNTFNTRPQAADKLLEAVDGLNVSLQSSVSHENNDILNAVGRHNRIDLLKRLNTRHAKKIRTSINLTRGGIDTGEKLMKTLVDLQEIGCLHVKINELQHSDLYVSFEDMMGVKYEDPYSHGCSTEITLDGISMKLLLKRSCFVVETSKKASLVDLLKVVYKMWYSPRNKFAVMYEDSSLKGGWRHDHAHS